MDSSVNEEIRDSALLHEGSVLAKDLMDYKLGRSASPVNATAKNLRQLSDEIEDKNPMLLEKLCTILQASNGTVLYQSFSCIAEGIFCDGVNWGRIIILFVFGAKLAKYCFENGMVEQLDNIPDWIGQTVAQHGNWIERNGGLKNLSRSQDQKGVGWKTLFAASVLGAGAAILMNVCQ